MLYEFEALLFFGFSLPFLSLEHALWRSLLVKFYPDERVALFVDGANLYAAAKALGFDIDYGNLLKVFRERAHLVRALYYTAIIEDQEYSSIRPLVDWLDYNGFTMVTKPTKEFVDATGRRKIKGNMDIELAVDVMHMAQHLDHVVILSGDGDFRYLVQAVQNMGKRVTVVSTLKTKPPMIADDLRRQADEFVDLMELKDLIGRAGQRSQRNDPVEYGDDEDDGDFEDDDDIDRFRDI